MKETLRAVMESVGTHLTFTQRIAIGLEYRLQMKKIRFSKGDI